MEFGGEEERKGLDAINEEVDKMFYSNLEGSKENGKSIDNEDTQ